MREADAQCPFGRGCVCHIGGEIVYARAIEQRCWEQINWRAVVVRNRDSAGLDVEMHIRGKPGARQTIPQTVFAIVVVIARQQMPMKPVIRPHRLHGA